MPVRVFISYAHDDPAHEDRVRSFWHFLRGQGVDARLDLAVAGGRVDWAEWMTREVRDADRVLVIASPDYKRRAEGDAGPDEGRGVQWEARLIRDVFYADQRAGLERVLPVVLPGCSADDLPLWLAPASVAHYVVSDFTVSGGEALLRLLTGQPLEIIPSLGVVPVLPPRDAAGPSVVAAQNVASGGEYRLTERPGELTEQPKDSPDARAELAQRTSGPGNSPVPAITAGQSGPESAGTPAAPPVPGQAPGAPGRRGVPPRLAAAAAGAAFIFIGVLVATSLPSSGARSSGNGHISRPTASVTVTPARAGGSSSPASSQAGASPVAASGGLVRELTLPLKPAGQYTVISLGFGSAAPHGLIEGSYERGRWTGLPELDFSAPFKLGVSADAGKDSCSSELVQNSRFSPIVNLRKGLLICVETVAGNALLEITQNPDTSGTLHLRETYWRNATP
jgi:hypothetical protein